MSKVKTGVDQKLIAEDCRCNLCGVTMPRPGLLVKHYRSFSKRYRWVCSSCKQRADLRAEIRFEVCAWVIAIVAIAASLVFGSEANGYGMNLAGYLVGSLSGLILHEAGHALVATGLGLRVWRIELGVGKRWGRFYVGHTQINLRPLPTCGYVVFAPKNGRFITARIMTAIVAGPLVNLLLVWLAWTFLMRDDAGGVERFQDVENFGVFFIAANVIILIASLWPHHWRFGGIPMLSDGGQVWQLLRALGSSRQNDWRLNAIRIESFERIERREHETALSLLDEARGDTHSEINRLVVLIRLGRFAEAFEHGRTLLKQEGLEPVAQAFILNNTAWAGLLTGEKELLPELQDYSDRALDLQPGHVALLGTGAAISIVAGSLDQGTSRLQQSMNQDQDGAYQAIHTTWLAVAEAKRGNIESSLELARSARSLDSESREVSAILEHFN